MKLNLYNRSYWVILIFVYILSFTSADDHWTNSTNVTMTEYLDIVGSPNCLIEDNLQFVELLEDPITSEYFEGPPEYVWVDPTIN
jgi:hypothetical protein